MKRTVFSLMAAVAFLPGCGPQAGASPAEIASTLAPATSPTSLPVAKSDAVPAGAFVFFEDFEQGTARWQLPAGTEPVAWRLLNALTCGGKYTMLIGQDNQVPFAAAEGESVLTLKSPLDLTRAVRPQLKYDVKGLAYPADALTIQAEIQPSGEDWRPWGRAVNGAFVFMGSVVADLTPYAGKSVGLRFRARFKPAGEPAKGMYLDDVVVIEPR